MLKIARAVYFEVIRCAAAPWVGNPAAFDALGNALGALRNRIGYVGPRRSRELYLRLMAKALPGLPRRVLEDALAEFWRNHQKNVLDLFVIPEITTANLSDYVEYDGLAYLDEALAAGRGAIIAPPHFGDERLIHIFLALQGYPVSAMTSSYKDAPVNIRRARLDPARRLHELIFPEDNPRLLYKTLQRNRILQFSPTAFGGKTGVWIDCFGQRLLINSTPARLAVATGAPLLPAFIYRLPRGRHRLVVEPPVRVDKGPGQITALTEKLLRIVEARVARDPGQFYWMWLVIRTQETQYSGPSAEKPAVKNA